MPRTILGEKYSKVKVSAPNHLSELMKRYKKAQGISDVALAEKLGTSRKTVNGKLNQSVDSWSVGDLKMYGKALKIPQAELLAAIGGATT